LTMVMAVLAILVHGQLQVIAEVSIYAILTHAGTVINHG